MKGRQLAPLLVAAIVAGCAGAADGRHPSGIPETLDGQPVLIGLAAVVHAVETTDGTPFLVGGWFNDASAYVCSGAGSIGRDPSPLLTGCATGIGGASPSSGVSRGIGSPHVFWDGHRLPTGRAPTIVRVHTHDKRATDCRADAKASCEAVVVVEEVLWTGDAWTQADPVSVVDAVRTLESLNIMTDYQVGPQSSMSLQRELFTTAVREPCPSPWPHEVFELHGDPRFGLLAVFPDEAARTTAQTELDPESPRCASDPRIERPGAAAWAGDRNVLVLVYGEEAQARMQAALDGSIDVDRYTSFPPESLDESYRFVDDALASLAAGIEYDYPLTNWTSSEEVYRRFEADALSYTIGEGRPVSEADLGPRKWEELQALAVPGTATLYIVDHPSATDPTLRTETIVAFQLREPATDTWQLVVVPPATAR